MKFIVYIFFSIIVIGCQTPQPNTRSISSNEVNTAMEGRVIIFNFDAKPEDSKNQQLYRKLERQGTGKFDMIENHCMVSFGPVLKGEKWQVTKVEADEKFPEFKRIYLTNGGKEATLGCSSKGISMRGITDIELTTESILSAFEERIQFD